MTLTLRRADERGKAKFSWLDSRHTFSFGQYVDPHHMGFGPLRVINDDWIAGGGGFPTHGHADMEIITYVLEGALEHKDSLGTGSQILPGDVQRMSAGRGIRHSEYNASKTDPVHLLQIWIMPAEKGLTPSYEQKTFADDEKRGRLCLVASRDGREGSVTIRRDADMFATLLDQSEAVRHELRPGRAVWCHVARGSVTLNGQPLSAGDAVAVEDPGEITVVGVEDGEVLMFDMAV